MGSWFDRAARTFGRTVEVHPGGAKVGVTVRAFLQPILDRREEHNEFGDYLYLKYLLPNRREEKKGSRPPRRRKRE